MLKAGTNSCLPFQECNLPTVQCHMHKAHGHFYHLPPHTRAPVLRTLDPLCEQFRHSDLFEMDPEVTLSCLGIYLLLRCTKQTEFSCVNPISFPPNPLIYPNRVCGAWAKCPKFPRLSSIVTTISPLPPSLYLCLYKVTTKSVTVFNFFANKGFGMTDRSFQANEFVCRNKCLMSSGK